MKILNLTLLAVLTFAGANVFSQSNSVFIVIDEIAENFLQLKSEYSDHSNVYVTDGISPNAVMQISNSMEDLQIDELHIYVSTKPGAIVFNSIAITTDNVNDLSVELKALGEKVANKVVIHSEVVFTGNAGIQLKQSLEDITGLVFTTQNGIN